MEVIAFKASFYSFKKPCFGAKIRPACTKQENVRPIYEPYCMVNAITVLILIKLTTFSVALRLRAVPVN